MGQCNRKSVEYIFVQRYLNCTKPVRSEEHAGLLLYSCRARNAACRALACLSAKQTKPRAILTIITRASAAVPCIVVYGQTRSGCAVPRGWVRSGHLGSGATLLLACHRVGFLWSVAIVYPGAEINIKQQLNIREALCSRVGAAVLIYQHKETKIRKARHPFINRKAHAQTVYAW